VKQKQRAKALAILNDDLANEYLMTGDPNKLKADGESTVSNEKGNSELVNSEEESNDSN
jgi:hypothetical protein